MTRALNSTGRIRFNLENFLAGSFRGKRGVLNGNGLFVKAWNRSPNNPQFPSATLRSGKRYRQTTNFKFSLR